MYIDAHEVASLDDPIKPNKPTKAVAACLASHVSDRTAMSCTGTLKKFMEGKGFGFLEHSDGSGDTFVHFSQLTNGGSDDMLIGAEMSFDVESRGHVQNQRQEAWNAGSLAIIVCEPSTLHGG